MAGKQKDLMELRQIVRLKTQGKSNRSIGELLGIHRNTVNRYVQIIEAFDLNYAELLELDDKSLSDLFPSESEISDYRYSTLSQYFPYFEKELKKPGCTLNTLWMEYKQKHPDGYQSSRFNDLVKAYQQKVRGSCKLEHKAGEKLFVDFTGKKLPVVDKTTGEIKEMEVFVGILPCSQYTFVTAVESQKKEDFIAASIGCLEYFGGTTTAIVPDNLKSGVTKASSYQPNVNRSYKDMGMHYGAVIAPTRANEPTDKALVEGAVKLVYQRIFYPLSKHTFFSLSTLNEAIRELLEQYNNKHFSLSTQTRRGEFLSLEKEFLKPLPAHRYTIRQFKRLTVQKMGYVFLSEDKHYYSVPFRFIGRQVQVQYNQHGVEIFADYERIATHQRDASPGNYTTNKDHLASNNRAYSEWSLEYFQRWAKKIGPYTFQFITETILKQTYPEIGYKRALGILTALVKNYGGERVENACERAQGFGRHGYNTIRDILEKGLDREAQNIQFELTIPSHKNIRGNQHYQ